MKCMYPPPQHAAANGSAKQAKVRLRPRRIRRPGLTRSNQSAPGTHSKKKKVLFTVPLYRLRTRPQAFVILFCVWQRLFREDWQRQMAEDAKARASDGGGGRRSTSGDIAKQVSPI